MRRTLTLDADVAERITGEVRRTGKSRKQTVTDALRLGLGLGEKRSRVPRFEVDPHPFGLKARVAPDRLNQLVDELEAEHIASRIR